MELSVIGYFTKTHGVKGHLVLKDEANFVLEGLNAIFLESATGKAPYFIEEAKETNNGIILKLEELDSVEKAKKFIGKEVFIESRFVEEEELEQNFVGFELIDKTLGSLGKITNVSHNGLQDLIVLVYQGREVILPLVEEFVEKIDEENRTIFYNAPRGLVEVYLEAE